MVRFSFLLMLSILTLVSCGDDDSNDVNSSDLVATWAVESSRSGSITDLAGTETDIALIYVSGDIEIEFKDDGSFEQTGGGVYDVVTIFDGDTLSIQQTTINSNQSGMYTAVNGRLEGVNASANSSPVTTDNAVTTYTIANDKLTIDLTGTAEQGTQVSQLYGTAVYKKQ